MSAWGRSWGSAWANAWGSISPIFPAYFIQHGGSGATRLKKKKAELIKKRVRLERRIKKKPEFDWTPSIIALREELARVEWELEETKRIIRERKQRQRAEDEMLLLLTY